MRGVLKGEFSKAEFSKAEFSKAEFSKAVDPDEFGVYIRLHDLVTSTLDNLHDSVHG
jgi:hypothetical protein